MKIINNEEELAENLSYLYKWAIDVDEYFLANKTYEYPILIDKIGEKEISVYGEEGKRHVPVYKVYTKEDIRELAEFGNLMQHINWI